MNVYQIKVVLRHIRPPIWRRLQVPADITLGELHDILQIAMGWEEAHLHQFIVNGECYGTLDSEFLTDLQDESRYRLSDLAGKGGRLAYEYDFGDGWMHELKIEKTLAAEPGKHYPLCLAGERACPPEDCGGLPGYERLLAVLADPQHTEHEDMLDWIGDEAFDPEAFDPAAVNAALANL
ncbi:MAG: plasmid pRiA4b ORF-3 family protein [Gammaproteobacteria bacterium]